MNSSSEDLLNIASTLVTETMSTSEKVVTVASATDQTSSNITLIATTMGETVTQTGMISSAADQISSAIKGVADNSDTARQMTESAVLTAGGP